MAAGTPVIRYPSAGATDVPVDAPWQALKSPYDGTGTQVEVENHHGSDGRGSVRGEHRCFLARAS